MAPTLYPGRMNAFKIFTVIINDHPQMMNFLPTDIRRFYCINKFVEPIDGIAAFAEHIIQFFSRCYLTGILLFSL